LGLKENVSGVPDKGVGANSVGITHTPAFTEYKYEMKDTPECN
jgi:hypothetical protein